MSKKKIQIINNRDRYYNGARKGGILTITETELEKYKRLGFALVTNKKNIVATPQDKVPGPSRDEMKEILNHAWIQFAGNASNAKLKKLVDNLQDKDTHQDLSDIDTIKEKLFKDKIVTEAELEGKKDEEILQIAKDNWLTE